MAYEDGVFATFYDDWIKNERESQKKGYAVGQDCLMIRIQIPNSTDCSPRPAQEADKQRFPKSWQAYVTGKEPEESGFPLNQWPQLTVAELKILQANNLKTVEQLAEVADGNLHRLGHNGQNLKVAAQKFLASRNEVDELKQQNKELLARLEKLEGGNGKVERKRHKVASE